MAYEDTVRLVLELERQPPSPTLPPALDALFAQLAAAPAETDVSDVEDEIWRLWTEHEDPHAAALMNDAIMALEERRFTAAEEHLDMLLTTFPQFAEAWNKRATLHFLADRDRESVQDIHATLKLEPRHFGALSGFAQICLRAGDRTAAVIALQAALRVNPHLPNAGQAIAALQQQAPKTLH